MAEIERSDLFSDEAFEAPKELADELGKVENALNGIIEKGKESQAELAQARAIKDLTAKVASLEKEQKKLVDANQKLKEAQEKAKKAAAQQAEALDALDNRMGGVISRAKQMGKEFLALMRNPFILALATIIASLGAMAHAMKTFVTATGDGEDVLNRQKAVWGQFFNVLKAGWRDLGKSFVEALGEDGLQGLLFVVLSRFSPRLAAIFAKTAQEAKELADFIDEIETNMAINITKRAETELEYNRLLNEAEKVRRTDFEAAIQLIEKANKKKEEQLDIDRKLAKQHAEAVLLNIGLEHGLDKATVMRMSHAERDAQFTGEQMKKIAEAYAEVTMLDAKYEQEVRRNTSKLAVLYEQRRKEIVEGARREAEIQIENQENVLKSFIKITQQEVLEGTKTVKQAEKEILELRQWHATQHIQSQIKAFEKLLQLEQLNAEERAEIIKKLRELEFQLVNEQFNLLKEEYKISLDDIAAIYTDFTNSIGDLFNSLTENRLGNLDREEERLKKLYDKEIELAGDNEEAKERLEKKLAAEQEKIEKKRIETKRRAAIYDKTVSATQAAIQTSLAIVRMLADPGGFAGAALSISAGITGALQVAAILARDIPQFEKGGKTYTPWIIAGEKGFEKYRTPSGEVGYTPGVPTLMKLPVGTEITSHENTLNDIAANSFSTPSSMFSEGGVDIGKYFKSLEGTINRKREVHINISKKGIETAMQNAETRTKIFNDLFK